MLTQTLERQELQRVLDTLPDDRIVSMLDFAKRLQPADEDKTLEEIDAEIAALEAKYGTIPNAATIAAMKDAEAGIGKRTTVERIRAECDALRY